MLYEARVIQRRDHHGGDHKKSLRIESLVWALMGVQPGMVRKVQEEWCG